MLGSSEAERLAVNEDVAGSIPARAVFQESLHLAVL